MKKIKFEDLYIRGDDWPVKKMKCHVCKIATHDFAFDDDDYLVCEECYLESEMSKGDEYCIDAFIEYFTGIY